MHSITYDVLFFWIQIITLYFISHYFVNELYQILYRTFRNNTIAYSCIALLFFPGTVIHEVSHFLAATVLFLKVGEIQIFPKWENSSIKLGTVTYEKADVIRSVLIGIAPFFGAMCFFWFIHQFKLFPNDNVHINIFIGYLLVSISSNMFSSKQDLVDVIYLIPIALVIGVLLYLFEIRINLSYFDPIFMGLNQLLKLSNFYITISLGIHLISIILIKSLRFLIKR